LNILKLFCNSGPTLLRHLLLVNEEDVVLHARAGREASAAEVARVRTALEVDHLSAGKKRYEKEFAP
jgi:hypothetical protein